MKGAEAVEESVEGSVEATEDCSGGGGAVLEPVAFSVDMFVLFVFCFWRLALL